MHVLKQNLYFRCRQWLQACGRLDLINMNFDSSKAYEKYRVCSAHFEPFMFNNPEEKTRLLISAMPVMFQENELPDVGMYKHFKKCIN